ncbi:hypothetical protein ACJJTC_003012 [Scirpophaga incertulas]
MSTAHEKRTQRHDGRKGERACGFLFPHMTRQTPGVLSALTDSARSLRGGGEVAYGSSGYSSSLSWAKGTVRGSVGPLQWSPRRQLLLPVHWGDEDGPPSRLCCSVGAESCLFYSSLSLSERTRLLASKKEHTKPRWRSNSPPPQCPGSSHCRGPLEPRTVPSAQERSGDGCPDDDGCSNAAADCLAIRHCDAIKLPLTPSQQRYF